MTLPRHYAPASDRLVVPLALWSSLHTLSRIWICFLSFFLFPFDRMLWEVGLSNEHLELFCCIVLSQSVMAGQEMCWWNASIILSLSLALSLSPSHSLSLSVSLSHTFQYVLLTLLSAGNCWDIDLKKTKQNLYCLLILRLQHSILLIVQIKIKNCAKSSLLMTCSQKTTWLPYNPVNAEHLRTLYTWDWPAEQCAQ